MIRDTQLKLHLLDVGSQPYGDSILCEIGGRTILIDGAHPENAQDIGTHKSIQAQLAAILGQPSDQLHVNLLVITHAHSDHIGCVPQLVKDGLRADWALVADEKLGWGHIGEDARYRSHQYSEEVNVLMAALHEEPLFPPYADAELAAMLSTIGQVEPAYDEMLVTIHGAINNRLIRYQGVDDPALHDLISEFKDIGLQILGPTKAHLVACANHIKAGTSDLVKAYSQKFNLLQRQATLGDVSQLYQEAIHGLSSPDNTSISKYVNLQSIVLTMIYDGWSMLFTGDMQLAIPGVTDPTITKGVKDLRSVICEKQYDFVKVAHHGSKNGTDLELLKCATAERPNATIGICSGSITDKNHPDPLLLGWLKAEGVHWVRTDRNGLTTITVSSGAAQREVSYPPVDDDVVN